VFEKVKEKIAFAKDKVLCQTFFQESL